MILQQDPTVGGILDPCRQMPSATSATHLPPFGEVFGRLALAGVSPRQHVHLFHASSGRTRFAAGVRHERDQCPLAFLKTMEAALTASMVIGDVTNLPSGT